MHRTKKFVIFKVVAIFLIFAFICNTTIYGLAEDIKLCLGTPSPFPQSPATGYAGSYEYSLSREDFGKPHFAQSFLFFTIAKALEKNNHELLGEDLSAIIKQHLAHFIELDSLKSFGWENISRKDNAFYLPVTVEDAMCEFKFSRIKEAEKNNDKFLEVIRVNDGLVGIEVVGLSSDKVIDPNVIEAFKLAVTMGVQKIQKERTPADTVNIYGDIQDVKNAILVKLDKSYSNNPHHGLAHSDALLEKARILAGKRGCEKEIDWRVLTAICLLHDIEHKNENHGEVSAQKAEGILKELTIFTKAQVQRIKTAIALHDDRSSNSKLSREKAGIEAQIIYDVDQWDAFGTVGIFRNIAVFSERRADYTQILEKISARYNTITFGETKELAQADYETTKNFFTKLNQEWKEAKNPKIKENGACGVVYFISKSNGELSPETLKTTIIDIISKKSGTDENTQKEYDYTLDYFKQLAKDLSLTITIHSAEKTDTPSQLLDTLFSAAMKNLKIWISPLKAVQEESNAKLDTERVIADHMLVPLYIANIFSIFTFGATTYFRGEVLQFIFWSSTTLISLLIWFLSIIISIGVHERGHYIEAINQPTVVPVELAKKQVKNWLNSSSSFKRSWASFYVKCIDTAVKSKNPFVKFLWNMYIVFFSAFGIVPGVERKFLTYSIKGEYNQQVAKQGRVDSIKYAVRGGIAAIIFIALGLAVNMQLAIFIGRVLFGSAFVSFLDYKFADPGELEKWQDQEKRAKDARGTKELTSTSKTAWKNQMATIKQKLIDSRMEEALFSNGEKLRAPWQFRNSGMGGRHTEKEYPDSNISMQETMFIPINVDNCGDAQEMVVKLQNRLKTIISNTRNCKVMGIGLEGGLAPYLSKQSKDEKTKEREERGWTAYIEKEEGDQVPEQRLWRMAKMAIEDCGYNKRGKYDVAIALDAAASEMQIEARVLKNDDNAIGNYCFWRSGDDTLYSAADLYDIYKKAIEVDEIPIISIEDGFAEDDDEGWKLLMNGDDKVREGFKDKLFIIGDDSVTTRDSSIERGADLGLNNTFLCKANQIGTLSETLLAILVALGKDLQIVVSHRSKSPNDDMEAQIALACDAAGLKAGGGANTERLFKYGSVMQTMIEAKKEAEEKLEAMLTDEERAQVGFAESLIKDMVITEISAMEESTNAGIPTVGVKVSFGIKNSKRFRKFHTFTGATPVGTSAGTGEAVHLVDSMIYLDEIPGGIQNVGLFVKAKGDTGAYNFKSEADLSEKDRSKINGDEKLKELYERARRFEGKGCLRAAEHVENVLGKLFLGKTINQIGTLAEVDAKLLEAERKMAVEKGFLSKDADWKSRVETMQKKGYLGMNAILSQSLAMGRLIAHMQGKQLKDVLRDTLKETMAKTIVNNGGAQKNLEETAFAKIKNIQTEEEPWKALRDNLTFDELKKGLQNVNKNKPEGMPLFELLRKELPVYGERGEGEAPGTLEDGRQTFNNGAGSKSTGVRKTSKMKKNWIIANHITDSGIEAFMFSLLSLPKGVGFTRWQIIRYMFFSPYAILTVFIWAMAVYLAIAVHERGHYIKSIKMRSLYKEYYTDAKKNLDRKFYDPRKWFWNAKIIVLGPLGLFPGIIREGLNYKIAAPYHDAVSARGPKSSGRLGFFGIISSILLIRYGWVAGFPLLIFIGRYLLAFGEMGTLDFFFTDRGEYTKYRKKIGMTGIWGVIKFFFTDPSKIKDDKPAKKDTSRPDAWKNQMSTIKKKLIETRMEEVLFSNGEKLRAPWQFRNSGMGGKHTEKEFKESNISMQEMMFLPINVKNCGDAQEIVIRLQNTLKKIISTTENCGVLGIGLEGGLAPYIEKEKGDLVPEQRLWRMAKQAIERCGYNKNGKFDIALALDPAASEMQNAYNESKHLKGKNEEVGYYKFWRAESDGKPELTRDELLEIYKKAIEEDEIPIISIEDGFAENDDDGWKLIMKHYKDKLFIIGDDSVTTRDSSIENAADNDLNNTFLCKANQIGTLSETLLAILVALGKDLQIVVSHRSKSPNDDMEAQIALACDAVGLKAGGGANTERLYKYGSVMKMMIDARKEAQEELTRRLTPEERATEGYAEKLIEKMIITEITAREESTNAGIPTVGVKVSFGIRGDKRFKSFHTFTGATPVGTSSGTGEAFHLVDGKMHLYQIKKHLTNYEKFKSLFKFDDDSGMYMFDKDVMQSDIDAKEDKELSDLYKRVNRYEGKGCLNAVQNVEETLSKLFKGKTLSEIGRLTDVDTALLAKEKEIAINNGFLKKDADWKDQIEVMQRKGHLGMNAILAQSLAMGRLIAHMQGKELKDILRETLKETMAKVIMHHGGIDNLEETAFRKIPDKQAPNMWKILAETLTFDELKKGLQNVNKNNLKGKKLFEILREELPVYGDKAEQPLAKKKGQVSHTSVRRVIKKLFDTKNMQNFTVTARNTVREYLMQSEVVKKIGDLIPVDKLLKQLEETNFYYNVDSENISPCLLCPNRNNYTVAHPSLTNGNVYFTKTMIENLTQEDSELLAVLLTREVMCLHTGLEIYDGKNYVPAEKYGEKYAEKLEKALVGERLDNYLQLKVDNYLLQKKAYNWRNDQFYAPSAINKDENVFLIAGNMRFIFWGKDLKKITSKEVQEEYVKAINEEKFQVISITDSGSPEWEQFVEKYKDRLFIPDVRLVAGEGLASPVGDMENFSLAKKEVKEKVLTPQGALDSRGGVILKAKDGSNYFFWKEEGKQAVSREELLEIYRKALEEETLPIMTIEDSFISDMEWQNFLKQHKNELKKASDKTPLDKIALIEKETGVSMSSDLTPILLTSEEVTPEMTLSAGEKAVLLAVVEKRLEAKSVKATIPKWFVLPNDKDQASLKKQEIVRRNREQFDKKLAWIAGKSGLKFGDAENPLLVAVRDSSPIDQPGQNPTLLNVGLTDETVEGLAELLGDEYLAYRFYTDFIRDLAVVSGKATKDDFTDVNLMSIIPWDSAVSKRKWRVQTSKEMYSKKVGKTFPQDPFEQLDLAVSLVALCNTRHDGPTRPFEVNAVMVQEMSLNVLVGDFAGIARSRDPLTGKKEINGTCKEAVLGSEISELKGLEALTEKYPEMKNELRDLLLEVEKCIEDMALIEFGVVRNRKTKVAKLNLLQVKKGTSSKEAFVRMIYDLVQEKIITQKEAGVRLKEIDLEALKYEPVKEIPQDARNVGRGKVASHGTTQGVAVFSAKKALEYKKKGVPTILVKPITTAEDKNAISLSAGVIALEEFRNHAQELSLKYKVPAVVEVTGSNFDTVTHEITLSGKHIEEGKTVLMLTKDGRVFVREIEPSQIEDEVLMTRKYALEEFIVEAMIWQIEAEGYQPELTVDKYGVGELWNEVLEDQKISVEEYSQAKSIRRQDNQAVIQGVKDVVRGVNQTLEEIALEERIISAESIEGLAQKVEFQQKNIQNFTYFLWEIYDNFAQKVAEEEGLTIRTKERIIKYTNLDDAKREYIKKIAQKAPEAFVAAVFCGVRRHKMCRYIFRTLVVDYFEDADAREFFKKVINYGAEYGYSGDERARDYQSARLFSHFAKVNSDFAAEAILELDAKASDFLLDDLRGFYVVRHLKTKSFDKGFATCMELLNVLTNAANRDTRFNILSNQLRQDLRKEIDKREEFKAPKEALRKLPQTIDAFLGILKIGLTSTLSQMKMAFSLVRDTEDPNSLILYADDIIDKGAVVDLKETLESASFGQKKIFSKGQIILYVKKREKDDKDILGLEALIKEADPSIEVFIAGKNDLKGGRRQDFESIKEMSALKEYAMQKLHNTMQVKPNKKQVLGIFRSHSGDMTELYECVQKLEMPVIIFGKIEGAYSFAQALEEAVKLIKSSETSIWYKYIEQPIEPFNAQEMREKFEMHVKQILSKA